MQDYGDGGAMSLKLTDTGSQNGTYVGSLRLDPEVPHSLRDGDVIGFGLPANSAAHLMQGLVAAHVRNTRTDTRSLAVSWTSIVV